MKIKISIINKINELCSTHLQGDYEIKDTDKIKYFRGEKQNDGK